MPVEVNLAITPRVRGCVMNITIDQAVEIYARGFRCRIGHEASRSARIEADRLKDAGDDEGFAVWCKVAVLVEQLEDAKIPPVFRE